MSHRFIAILSALLVTIFAEASFAQLVCTPGKGCKIEMTPPPVQWTPPSVGGQVGGQGHIDPSVQANAQWQAELARRARWEAYFSWRAQVEASARLSINARIYIDRLKWQVRGTADPYAAMPAPYYQPPSDAYVRFPRLDMGLLAFCYGAYTGPGDPMYLGYCPAFRYRMNRRWGIAFDPAIVSSQYEDFSFGMVGLRPGVQFSFAQGKRDVTASNAYAVAGLDVWLPFSKDELTPSVFLGGHVGVGAMISGGRWGFGFEVRGLARGGLGNQDNEVAHAMSSFRVGFEGRAPVIYLSFP